MLAPPFLHHSNYLNWHKRGDDAAAATTTATVKSNNNDDDAEDVLAGVLSDWPE